MAKVQSFSIADGELKTWAEFKAICKQRRLSTSWVITELIAKEVQREKELRDDVR